MTANAPTAQEVRIVADVSAKPGKEDALRQALIGMLAPSRAEPGCLLYELHEDIAQPGHFIFFERWASLEAIELHTKMPHYVALGPVIEPLIVAPGKLSRVVQIGG